MSHCANCGAQVTTGAHYCTACGAAIEGGASDPSTQTRRPSAETLRLQEQRLLAAVRQATLGEYEILGEIGKGGMAVVYLAHDLSLDRKVAIKVMTPALQLSDPGVLERFQREARTAAQLSHPNIIPVYAVKRAGELVYFVMKYIKGRSLEAVIKETGPMPAAVVQTVMGQVGGALGHAHRNGVVHRDMKPGNVMLDADGWVMVTDFGIAKVANAKALTQTGGVLGTPAYMSPEQCSGGEVTGASDQYSLGIMAYEMLAGRQPFAGVTLVNIIYDHCHTPPTPLLQHRPDCPPRLAAGVMRMLEKNPADRFLTVEDAVAAIGVAPETESGEARRRIVTLAQPSAASPHEQFRTPGTPVPATGVGEVQGARRSALRWVVSAAGALAVVGGWMVLRPPARPASGGAPAVVADTAPGHVAPRAIERLDLAPLAVSLVPGAQAAIRVTGRDAAGDSVAGTAVTWQTSNPRVATVSPDGVVKAVAPGVAQLTALSGGSSAAAVVTVTAPARKTGPPEPAAPVAPATTTQPTDTTAQRQTPPAPIAQAPAAPATALPTPESTAARESPPAVVPSPPPPSPPPADPRPEIEGLLDAYRRAIESRDLGQLKTAYPGLTSEQETAWRGFFGNVTQLSATLRIQDLRVSGDRAEAGVTGTYEFRSGTRQTQHVEFVAGFERGPTGWRLVSIK